MLDTMQHTWKAIRTRFAAIMGHAVSVDDCRAYADDRRKAGISEGSIHTELGHLRTVLRWAEQRRLIDRAPHIERPPKPEPKDRYLTRDEAARLLAGCNAAHVRLAILLMISTGSRNAAALELTWDRVDFAKRLIHLRNPFDKTRRKGRATVPMNEGLRMELERAHKAALSPFVVEWAGRPVKSIRTGIEAAAANAGLVDVSPHVLRHSAAVWLAEDGHSMSEISQFLGHSGTAITEKVYAKYSPDHLRGLAASLEIRK